MYLSTLSSVRSRLSLSLLLVGIITAIALLPRGESVVPNNVLGLTERQAAGGALPDVDGTPFVLTVEPISERPRTLTTPAVPPAYDLIVPVQGVHSSELVDSFSDVRGSQRRHLAIDIPAPTGTPVLAATSGNVLRKHYSARGGITLYLLDDSGQYVYYYAHLDGYAEGLEAGDAVEQGQVIGYVGFSGNAHESLPHLHFAIWVRAPGSSGWSGPAVNPFLVLTRQAETGL
jgi:peptidoglycan LD-endopeptidase LytH